MTTFKTAFLLAFSRQPEARWRQLMVTVATFSATLCLLVSASVVAVCLRGEAVGEARAPLWSEPVQDAPVVASLRAITVDGHQWPVVWLEQRRPVKGGLQAMPPGLGRMPEPGTAVLSPGLLTRGLTAASLGMKTSEAGTGPGGAIGDAGLRSRSEGLIYAVPERGRTLGSGGALIGVAGYAGSTSGQGGVRTVVDTDPDIPTPTEAIVGWLLLLLGPTVYLLISGARAASPVRIARSEVLYRLGIGPRRIRAILACEGAILALPAVALAVLAWIGLIMTVRRVPWSDTTLTPGSLIAPGWVAAASCLTVLALVTLASSLVRVPKRGARPPSRVLPQFSALPLFASAVCMASARWVPRSSSLRVALLVLGALLFLATTPWVVPALAGWGSKLLGSARAPMFWLASARLRSRATALSRPATMVAALVFVSGAGFALYEAAAANFAQANAEAKRSVVVHVNWRDARAGDAGHAVEGLSTAGVTMAAEASDDGTAIFRSCDEATRAARKATGGKGCSGGSLDPQFVAWVSARTGRPVQLLPAEEPKPPFGNVVLVGTERVTDAAIWRAMEGLPAVNIVREEPPRQRFTPPAFVLLGWAAAMALAVLGTAREIGDRVLLTVTEDRGLTRLGIPSASLERVHLLCVGAPIVVASVMGWIAAALFALVGHGLEITAANLFGVTMAAAAAALAAVIALVGVTVGHRGLRSRTR